MSDEDLVTIADIDKAAATVIVAPTPPSGEAPASDSAASATAPTEAPQGEQAPAESTEAEQPSWFVKEKTKLSRQRANAERRALRAEAELAALRGNPQQRPAPQARSASELKSTDFTTWDEYQRVLTKETARAEVKEALTEVRQAQAQTAAEAAAQQARSTFEKEATAQAKAAGIDFADAWEALLDLPKEDVSEAFAAYLYQAADNKAALVDHFAKNPDEVARISSLHPAAAFKELAKVDLQFGAKPKPNATQAPPPPPRVGGRTVTQQDWRTSNDMDAYAAGWHKARAARGE